MRLFIGVALDENVKYELFNLQEIWLNSAIKHNKTIYDNLHLTLLFLGEINPSSIDDIMEALNQYLENVKSFEIKIYGVGSFIKPDGHILWAGIKEGKDKLKALYNQINQAIKSLEYVTNDSRFVPHITLARRVKFKDLEDIKLPLISLTQSIHTITLFHSHQVQGVLTYTPLDSIQLI